MAAVCKISKEVQFDAGHRVPNHKSKCRNPHGHRYRVVVHCVGHIIEEPGASDEGMLIDFSDLKEMMTSLIHDVLDHGFIVYEHDGVMRTSLGAGAQGWKVIVFPYVPTAENLARWCWDELAIPLEMHYRGNLTLECVEVWETPTSMACYYGVEL